MRITKRSDSPLNESEFSDYQPLPPSLLDPNFSAAYKPNCYYHPDQLITNFCRSQGCLLPLCPECVKLHATNHRTHGTHGEYDTIDHTVSECFEQIQRSDTYFREDEIGFKDLLKLTGEYHNLMMNKLMQTKSKAIELIEIYFKKVAVDLEKRVFLQVQRFQNEIRLSLDKMKARQGQIYEYMSNLRSPRVLKTTISLLSTPFIGEQAALHKEYQSLFNLLNSQKIDVLCDDNTLHNINCNLVKYINIYNKDLYNVEEVRVPIDQTVITGNQQPINPVNIVRSQSPVLVGTVRSSQNIIASQPVNFQQQQQKPQISQISLQNLPINQSKITYQQTPTVTMSQYHKSSQQLAPQNRPLLDSNINAPIKSSMSKIHRVHPGIPGDPVILDFNKAEKHGNGQELKETRPIASFIQIRNNPNFMLTQSPPPMRVRSVSPQMVSVAYNNNNNNAVIRSNNKMNAVYLESQDRGRMGLFEREGLRNSSKKKKV